LGDRTLLPSTISRVLAADIAAQLGDVFARAVADVHGSGWQGPFTTPFGVHLVRVTWRGEPTPATLENARAVVTREWTRAHTVAMKEQFHRELARRYIVRVEAYPEVTQLVADRAAGR
jgi:peptidyl-prolyl cis-trans isomerase C